MERENENYVGINVCGAQVGVHVSGLDKPVRAVGRGLKRVFGLSKANINKGARYLVEKTN